MFLLKDCSTSCETGACNSELDAAAAKFSAETPQDKCYACSYVQRENGDTEGNIYCADEPDKMEGASVSCPMYANTACYTGSSAHYVSHSTVKTLD